MICINLENALGSHGFTRDEVHHLPPVRGVVLLNPSRIRAPAVSLAERQNRSELRRHDLLRFRPHQFSMHLNRP